MTMLRRQRFFKRAIIGGALLLSLAIVCAAQVENTATQHGINQSSAQATSTETASAEYWVKQKTNTLAWLRAVYFLDEQTGWLGGGGGALMRTTDGGANWNKLDSPTADVIRDVYFADAKHGWLVCDTSGQTPLNARTYLMQTDDGGATWFRVNVTGDRRRLTHVFFTRDGNGWAFGELGAIYNTTDHGETWDPLPPPTRYLLYGGYFLNARTGWLVGAGGTILATGDSGTTWRLGSYADTPASTPVSALNNSALNSAPAPPRARLRAVYFVDAQRGWTVGMEGAIFATRNGGRSWLRQISNVTSDLYDVKFTDPVEGWAAGANGTLLHTRDGGGHWTQVETRTTHLLERLHFISPTRGFAVGFGGTLLSYSLEPNRTNAPQIKSALR